MGFLLTFLWILRDVMTIIIIIRVVMSWFALQENNIFFNIVYQITEPILSPLRRVIPRVGIFDLTPMIAILLIQGLYWVIAIILT